MSKNTQIFSEAIAEAKAIRETAMVNAKLALEEAFAPRIQEMMSDRFSALAEEEEKEEGFEEGTQNGEISLEELLAELDGLEEGEDDVDYTMGSDDENQLPNPPSEINIDEAIITEDDEDAVGEITVEELKDIIKDVMSSVMGGEEEAGEEEGPETEEEAGEEEELDLDEILAELALGETDDNDEDDLNEYGSGSAAGNAKAVLPNFHLKAEVEKLAAKLGMSFEEFYAKVGNILHGGKGVGNLEETKRLKTELIGAMKTIEIQRTDLNEVNLLNAKLLYVNKLFKAKNLTESQKVKVINAFDRAETVKEAKNVFEILSESLTTEKAKSQIKESLSFASKAAGVAPTRQPILENDAFVLRMQKIAGIIK